MSGEPASIEPFKRTGYAIQVPARIFDACAECGEPITGMAEMDYLLETAWHRDCGPMTRLTRSLLRGASARATSGHQ
jgi:hypothetical protein